MSLSDYLIQEITPLAELPTMSEFLDRLQQRESVTLLFRNNFSAYDACYLALAEALDATLLTCDKAMASARLRHVQVEFV